MKPIRLDIAGLNSFRKAVTIDFSELLCDGLFGIFGPTGSGKSTVLDAMTLALYGSIHRTGKLTGVINDREVSCSVSFTFEVLYGAERQRYTVERLYQRSKAGGIAARRQRLVYHDSDGLKPAAEKAGEVNEKVKELLGINADDFLRAVVLPQGAFAEFLGLSSANRSRMLERLFDFEHLGERLQKTLRARRDRAAGDLRVVQERMAALADYDDVTLLRLEEELRCAERNLIELSLAVEREDAAFREARSLADLASELHSHQASNDSRRAERERVSRLKEIIARAERSRRVIPAIQARASATKAFTECRRSYQESAQSLEHAGAQHEQTKRERDEVTRESDAAIARLERNRSALIAIQPAVNEKVSLQAKLAQQQLDLQTLSTSHNNNALRADEAKRAADAARREIECARIQARSLAVSNDERIKADHVRDLLRDRTELAQSLSEQRGSVAETEKSVGRLRSQFAECQQALEKIVVDRCQIQEEQEKYQAAFRDIDRRLDEASDVRDRLTHAIDDLENLETEIAGREAQMASDVKELATKTEELSQCQANLKSAHEEESRLQRELGKRRQDQEKALQRHTLLSLSKNLADGVPCQLCGSPEHPSPFHQRNYDQARVATDATDIADLEQKLQKGRAEFAVDHERYAVLNGEVVSLQSRIEIAEREIAARRQSLVDRLRPLLSIDDEPTRVQALHRRDENNRAIARMERERDLCETQIKEAVSRGEKMEARRHEVEVELGRDEATVKERERSLQDCRTDIDRLERGLNDIDVRIADRSGGKSLDEAERSVLAVAERQLGYERIQDELVEKEKRLADLECLEREARIAADESSRHHDRCAADVARLRTEIDKRSEMIGRTLRDAVERDQRDRAIDDLIAEVEAEVSFLRKKKEAAMKEETDSREHLARCEQDYAHARDQMNRVKKEMEERESDVREAMAQTGCRSADDALHDALDDDTLDAHRADLQRIQRELDMVEARMEELRKKIGDRSISLVEVDAMERSWIQRKSEADEAAASFGGLRREVEIAREKNGEWRATKERMGTIESQSRQFDRMERYLHGNRFVDFIANERLQDICSRATRTLDVLTSGRYEVTTRAGEGFIIGDNRSGGKRAPSSLSGGETFLVSLSLALALSDTLQFEHRPLEFFFLDEGFGSLDAERIETVIDALERLASPNRAIGLISHVDQIRDRIQRKLIVHPPNGLEGTTVVTG